MVKNVPAQPIANSDPQPAGSDAGSTSGSTSGEIQNPIRKPGWGGMTADHQVADTKSRGRARPKSPLLPRRRVTVLGIVISSVCHLIILSLFFWAVRLGVDSHALEPDFQLSPTWWKMFSLLGGWSQFWLVSIVLAAFTMISWPFHSLFVKLLGLMPLVYGISRQFL